MDAVTQTRIRIEVVEQARDSIVVLRMTNSRGCYVELTNYGGRIMRMMVPDRDGVLGNIVLHYDALEDYYCDNYYLGAAIGPIANRISNAQYVLNGVVYRLPNNDGSHSNHSGGLGLHRRVFDYKIAEAESSVILSVAIGRSEGFCADTSVTIKYTFLEDNSLTITYQAQADDDVVLNLTNHTYFNLNGAERDISQHLFSIASRQYLETDQAFLPTGNTLSADGVYNFSTFKPIGRTPYNTYYIFEEHQPHRAYLREVASGRQLEVETTQPGLLFYTGAYLGGKHQPYGGVCLETQGYPDATSNRKFPTIRLKKGETYYQATRYRISTFEL